VLAIAAAVVVTAAGGACAAASGAGTTSTAPGAAGRTATPSTSARTGGDVTNIAQDTEVAPLKRVVVPDALAIAGTSVTAGQLARIRKIKQVKDVIAVDAGAIQLQNHRVNAFAVDPSAFRSWTPPATAKSENLWAALAADRFVVASADAQTLALKLGTGYSLVGRSVQTVTMGASGPLGIPGINLLVSRTTGGKLDLIPSLAVLVNAPSADPAKLGPQLKKIIGSGTSVLDLHAKKYTGTTSGTNYLDLYKQAAAQYCPGLSWTVLAAIGQIESDHGRNAGPSSAGALGPMQFMPATWKAYGVDGDHDGKADITNPYDAVPAAAHYLCANGAAGGGKRLYNAIFHYNHADWYVQEVLSLAQAYGRRYG
jgi:hypothetical protein